MQLTEDHLQVAFNAWAAAQDGGGVVLEDPGLYPAAHELAEQGWVQRRFVGPGDVMSWWWSPHAETALAINALTSAEGRHN
jgi:hypothetical protein